MPAKAEANVVVAIGGPVAAAIGAAQVHGVVVPTAAAQHAVGAAVVPSLGFLCRCYSSITCKNMSL